MKLSVIFNSELRKTVENMLMSNQVHQLPEPEEIAENKMAHHLDVKESTAKAIQADVDDVINMMDLQEDEQAPIEVRL